MQIEIAEAVSLDERGALTLEQLMEVSELPEGDLRALVDYGAMAPIDPGATHWMFTAHWVGVARRASRLRRDFELDAHSLSVVLQYVERIDALEGELRSLRAQLG